MREAGGGEEEHRNREKRKNTEMERNARSGGGGRTMNAPLVEPEALVAGAERAIVVKAFAPRAHRGVLVVVVVAGRGEGEAAVRARRGSKGRQRGGRLHHHPTSALGSQVG